MYKYTSGGPFSKFKALFGILEGNLKNFALNLVRKIKERSVKLFIMTSQGKNDYENCLNVLIWGQREYFWRAGSNFVLRNIKKILKDFLGVTNPFIARPKTTMKIAKIYLFGAKKYTSEAKIILLQQYTFIWKFCRNTPELNLFIQYNGKFTASKCI